MGVNDSTADFFCFKKNSLVNEKCAWLRANNSLRNTKVFFWISERDFVNHKNIFVFEEGGRTEMLLTQVLYRGEFVNMPLSVGREAVPPELSIALSDGFICFRTKVVVWTN